MSLTSRWLPLLLFLASLGLIAQTLDPTGLAANHRKFRQRLPTSNPVVFYELDIEGGAVFYSMVQPFRGVVFTPDGRNVYLGR